MYLECGILYFEIEMWFYGDFFSNKIKEMSC